MALKQGLLHVYTGEAKGKTTAALGLAFRAAGSGLKVLVIQFFKPLAASGELAWQHQNPEGQGNLAFRRPDIRHPFFDPKAESSVLSQEITRHLEQALAEAHQGQWDVLVLDEINNALKDGFVDLEDFLKALNKRPACLEVVCTGRGAPQALQDLADYVTHMTLGKHPFEKKIAARQGIEH
jgi:cob(I)alamin adenosyltransferase